MRHLINFILLVLIPFSLGQIHRIYFENGPYDTITLVIGLGLAILCWIGAMKYDR